MNILLDLICKELGVKIGKEWLGNDGGNYRINPDGKLIRTMYYDNLEEDSRDFICNIENVLTGKIKPASLPKMNQVYYIANPIHHNLYHSTRWGNHNTDYDLYNRGLVFMSKEEAVACSKDIIDFSRRRKKEIL